MLDDESQLEKMITQVRTCHGKLFQLKNPAEAIETDKLNAADCKEMKNVMQYLEEMFIEYGQVKTRRAIPGFQGVG